MSKMSATNNRDRLKEIMKAQGLSRQETADLLCVSVHTLNNWLYPDTCKAARPCPDWAIKLLICLKSDFAKALDIANQ